MKRYLVPSIEITMLEERDCICTSVMVDDDGTVDNIGRIPDSWLDFSFGG